MRNFSQKNKQMGRFVLLLAALIAILAFNFSDPPIAIGTSSQLDKLDSTGPRSVAQEGSAVVIGNVDGSALAVVAGRIITVSLSIGDIPDGIEVGTVTLDIKYDNLLLKPISCPETPDDGIMDVIELCNLDLLPDTIQIINIYAAGFSESRKIAIIELEVFGPGGISTALSIEVKKLTDRNGNDLEYLVQDQEIEIIKLGDVNCDGSITPRDASAAVRYYLGFTSGSQLCAPSIVYLPACDINQDGECRPSDASAIMRCYLGFLHQILCPGGNIFENPQDLTGRGDSSATQESVSLYMEIPTIIPGSIFTTAVKVDSDTELGTVAIDIDYDSTQFRVVDCQVVQDDRFNFGGCNSNYEEDKARFSTIMPYGASGSLHLVDVIFEHIGDTVATGTFALEAPIFTSLEDYPLVVTIGDHRAGDHWIYLPMIEQ